MSMEPVFAATFAVWLRGEPTTLRMVAGLESITAGELRIDYRLVRNRFRGSFLLEWQ